MIEHLKEYLEQFYFLEPTDIEEFISISHVSYHEKGELLVKAGHRHNRIHFLLDGLVRAYEVKGTGDERTMWIGESGAHLADPISILSGHPSKVNIEVVEYAIVASFDFLKMDEIEMKFPNLLKLKTVSLQRLLIELYERVQFFSLLTPQERFRWLSNHRPDYFDRLQQKHLASFIGVSEVHMSRLKYKQRSNSDKK